VSVAFCLNLLISSPINALDQLSAKLYLITPQALLMMPFDILPPGSGIRWGSKIWMGEATHGSFLLMRCPEKQKLPLEGMGDGERQHNRPHSRAPFSAEWLIGQKITSWGEKRRHL